jgi:uncharacterized membrane protein
LLPYLIRKYERKGVLVNMKKFIVIVIGIVIIGGIIVITSLSKSNEEATNNDVDETNKYKSTTLKPVEIEKDGEENAVINEEDISSTAEFYTYTIDGIKIRMFAVKASDGTIRTAFNTCQVCNPSPKAYFVQKGSNFECQNCGNLFETNRIGLERGGCNPIPITNDDRKEEENKIIIGKSFIAEYKENFVIAE